MAAEPPSSIFQNPALSADNNTLTFTLSPTRVTYANSLRRAIQTQVQILGFRADITEIGTTSDVKVFKNTTAMSNEMLADRVGLLPIVMPSPPPSGWEKDKLLFKLHVKNESPEEIRYVTASDFEVWEIVPERAPGAEDAPNGRKRIPNTTFFHPDPVSGETCLLALLKPQVPGQQPEEIHIEAYASLGCGREHTRFNPTSQCAYGYTRDEDAARVQALWVTWLREQKKLDPAELNLDPDRKASLEREFRSLEVYRCFKMDTEGEPYSYDFTVEGIRTMPAIDIVYQGILGLITLCSKYASLDKGDPPDTVEVHPADAQLKGFDFCFTGEDHTIGNLFQTWLDDNKIGRGKDSGGVTFAGYKIPHPLRDEMVLRIGVEDGNIASARLAVAQAAKGCADMFSSWSAQFSTTVGDAGLGSLPEVGGETKGPWEAHEQFKKREAIGASASARGRGRGGPAPRGTGRGGAAARGTGRP